MKFSTSYVSFSCLVLIVGQVNACRHLSATSFARFRDSYSALKIEFLGLLCFHKLYGSTSYSIRHFVFCPGRTKICTFSILARKLIFCENFTLCNMYIEKWISLIDNLSLGLK